MYIATVTQKGQITLPKSLRLAIGVGAYCKVRLEPGDGYIKVLPTQDIVDLAGTFVPKKNKHISPVAARDYMEKHYERV